MPTIAHLLYSYSHGISLMMHAYSQKKNKVYEIVTRTLGLVEEINPKRFYSLKLSFLSH